MHVLKMFIYACENRCQFNNAVVWVPEIFHLPSLTTCNAFHECGTAHAVEGLKERLFSVVTFRNNRWLRRYSHFSILIEILDSTCFNKIIDILD
jgi:hypothetical protein